MINLDFKDLIKARAHIGHLSSRWHPKMAPYIFCKHKNIHIINVKKTIEKLDEACSAMEKIVASGKKVIFISTKKQIKTLIRDKVSQTNMPYVTERWLGGMLTNFITIKKAIKKMESIDKMKKNVSFSKLSKKEKLFIDRDKQKLQKVLGSISNMKTLPGALFIVDIKKEKTALKEAKKLNIPIFAIVDTNSNPQMVNYPIPANDDTSKSVSIILDQIVNAINIGKKNIDKNKTDDAAEDDTKSDSNHSKNSSENKTDSKKIKGDSNKKSVDSKTAEVKKTTANKKSDSKTTEVRKTTANKKSDSKDTKGKKTITNKKQTAKTTKSKKTVTNKKEADKTSEVKKNSKPKIKKDNTSKK